jgi:hypothetical protein
MWTNFNTHELNKYYLPFPLAQSSHDVSTELATYIGFLHDIIAEYHERLAGATSPQVAREFLASIADKEIRHLGLDNDPTPKNTIKNIVESMGMKYQTFRVGDQMVSKLECPYAEVVHPRISTTNPICPIALLTLAAERVTNKRIIMTNNHLTREGAEYTLAPR